MAEQGYGSEAHVSCAPGYVSEEASVLRCGHQGEWEGVMHPCTKVTSNTSHSLPQYHYLICDCLLDPVWSSQCA